MHSAMNSFKVFVSPWQTECGANLNEDRQHKQIQMISAAFFQFVLFAIHNDRGDLLIHEDENDAEKRGEKRDNPPPKVV